MHYFELRRDLAGLLWRVSDRNWKMELGKYWVLLLGALILVAGNVNCDDEEEEDAEGMIY